MCALTKTNTKAKSTIQKADSLFRKRERERERGRQQQKTAAKASTKMIIPVRCFTCGKVPYSILIVTFIVIIMSMTVTVMGFCF